MDDETFKTSLRKFLKKVGVTSQQEIEKAVEAADVGSGTLAVNVTLTIPEIGLHHEIEGELNLGDD